MSINKVQGFIVQGSRVKSGFIGSIGSVRSLIQQIKPIQPMKKLKLI
jgi:hypothetical protein